MQASKSTGRSSLGEVDFDCKYPELVSLNNLALFILKKNFLEIGIPLRIL
jgi:hypothetical protein